MDHDIWIGILNSRQLSGIEGKCSGDETAKVDVWSVQAGLSNKVIQSIWVTSFLGKIRWLREKKGKSEAMWMTIIIIVK